jgi:hypothetical protein
VVLSIALALLGDFVDVFDVPLHGLVGETLSPIALSFESLIGPLGTRVSVAAIGAVCLGAAFLALCPISCWI